MACRVTPLFITTGNNRILVTLVAVSVQGYGRRLKMCKIAEEVNAGGTKEAPGTRNTPTKSGPAADAAMLFLNAAIDMSLQNGGTEWNLKAKAVPPTEEFRNHTVLSRDQPVADSLGSSHCTRKKTVFHGNSVHLPSVGNTPSPPSSIRSKHVIDNMFTKDVLLPRISNGK
jgi:hypothetical protein